MNTFLRFRRTSDKKNISNRRGFIIHVLTTIFVLFGKLCRLNNIIICFKKNWQHRDNEDNRIIAIIINSRAFTPRINCKNVITPAGSSQPAERRKWGGTAVSTGRNAQLCQQLTGIARAKTVTDKWSNDTRSHLPGQRRPA